jgi:hypothetical protein
MEEINIQSNEPEKKSVADGHLYENELHLIEKANNWYLSGRRQTNGIEVFRTQDEGTWLIKDLETGTEILMFVKSEMDGVITKLTFGRYRSNPEESNK